MSKNGVLDAHKYQECSDDPREMEVTKAKAGPVRGDLKNAGE